MTSNMALGQHIVLLTAALLVVLANPNTAQKTTGCPDPSTDPSASLALVGFRYNPSDPTLWLCNAVLLAPRWLLTSASCRSDAIGGLGAPRLVRVGGFTDGVDVPIKRVLVHPDFQKISNIWLKYDDLALLELETSVTFARDIQPTCLPWNLQGQSIVGERFTRVAYTWSRAGQVLKRVEMTALPSSTCNSLYAEGSSPASQYPNGITEDTFQCAGNPVGDYDTSRISPGAPLTHRTADNRWTLVGVFPEKSTAHRDETTELAVTVATKATLDWIENQVFT